MKNKTPSYQNEEYFDEYYANGLFHPTEAYSLIPHSRIQINAEEDSIVIGGIDDDVDSYLCYRKGMTGLWGQYRRDRTYYQIGESLKEFTRGWYKYNPNHWATMDSNTNMNEVKNFYFINQERYNWSTECFIKLIDVLVLLKNDSNIYIKGHEDCLDISGTNGFSTRPNTNMVTVYLDDKEQIVKTYLKATFFDYDVKSNNFNLTQLEENARIILNWINKRSA